MMRRAYIAVKPFQNLCALQHCVPDVVAPEESKASRMVSILGWPSPSSDEAMRAHVAAFAAGFGYLEKVEVSSRMRSAPKCVIATFVTRRAAESAVAAQRLRPFEGERPYAIPWAWNDFHSGWVRFCFLNKDCML